MVERLTCNEDVAGSTPVSGSIYEIYSGGVPEWSKGTDCKSVGEAFGGSNPPPTTSLNEGLWQEILVLDAESVELRGFLQYIDFVAEKRGNFTNTVNFKGIGRE